MRFLFKSHVITDHTFRLIMRLSWVFFRLYFFHFSEFKMIIQLLLLSLLPSLSQQQYTTCTDSTLDFQGYTYNVDATTNEKVWSHCKFPNPKFDHARCGLTVTTGYHWVCDPDYLISSQGLYKDPTINWHLHVGIIFVDRHFFSVAMRGPGGSMS